MRLPFVLALPQKTARETCGDLFESDSIDVNDAWGQMFHQIKTVEC